MTNGPWRTRCPLQFATRDSVAQLVEHATFNRQVLGSSPSGITPSPVIAYGARWPGSLDDRHSSLGLTIPNTWDQSKVQRWTLEIRLATPRRDMEVGSHFRNSDDRFARSHQRRRLASLGGANRPLRRFGLESFDPRSGSGSLGRNRRHCERAGGRGNHATNHFQTPVLRFTCGSSRSARPIPQGLRSQRARCPSTSTPPSRR